MFLLLTVFTSGYFVFPDPSFSSPLVTGFVVRKFSIKILIVPGRKGRNLILEFWGQYHKIFTIAILSKAIVLGSENYIKMASD